MNPLLAKIENNQVVRYPYDVSQLKQDNPNTSFPSTLTTTVLEEFSVFEIEYGESPVFDSITQRLETASSPTNHNGKWILERIVVDKTTEQIEADLENQGQNVRLMRDRKLSESDWTQLGDYSGQNKEAWVAYRQLLRDVPQQSGFPWNVEWPSKP